MWLNSPVTVGNGSDVLIQVTCSESGEGGHWSFSNGTTVPDPLTAFGISQDPLEGVLRIYPAPLIEGEGLGTYMCNVSGEQETLIFLLRKNPTLLVLITGLFRIYRRELVLYRSSTLVPLPI